MRLRQITVASALLGVLCVPAHADARDIGRNTLAPNDGWAAAERNGSALHTKIDSTERADREVARGAGAGRIP